MKYIFAILLLGHGLIHIMGFLKAFRTVNISGLSASIPKSMGLLFLLSALLFIIVLTLYLLENHFWFFLALVAVVISQTLIIIYWEDAKFGTIANVIILIVALFGFVSWTFQNTYKNDVVMAMKEMPSAESTISPEDLHNLPEPVQKYLNYVGVVGRPRVTNFKLTFKGKMRKNGENWFSFTSQQCNFFDYPARLFFMDATVKGLPTSGYHYYKDGSAKMKIKLLSLFPVVNLENPELFSAETVTFFNDLCLFAPSALIDDRIQWEPINSTSVRAYFRNGDTTISAILNFNKQGQLINFISEDRYDINQMKKYRFSTPISNYKNFDGYMLPSYGEAIWHYPDGEFVYGKFNLQQINYNYSG